MLPGVPDSAATVSAASFVQAPRHAGVGVECDADVRVAGESAPEQPQGWAGKAAAQTSHLRSSRIGCCRPRRALARDGSDTDRTNLDPADHDVLCPTRGERCNRSKGVKGYAPIVRRSGSLQRH